MSAWAAGSLRLRLLAATVVALAVALLLAGLALDGLFRGHVMRQFESTLTQQLDQLTARLDFDAAGRPQVDAQALSDPRWLKPYSGLYWQLDQMNGDGQRQAGVLRSRSLWDEVLRLQADSLADGSVHAHEIDGPQGARLLAVERTVRPADTPGARWRLVVAADLHEVGEALTRMQRVLLASLAVLLALLALAAVAQVVVGLRPLRALQRSLQAVQQGQSQRLQGTFPAEVQPLVDDFNKVLDRNAEVVARARTQAGNLAHALKTPLAVLDQAAARAPADGGAALATLVREQVAAARRQVDWQLARARMAATERLPGQRTAVAPAIAGLVRVMARVHAGRGLRIETPPDGAAPLYFAGEEQDLQEMLGNLLDNACKWAGRVVRVEAQAVAGAQPPRLEIRVHDDGPGIDAQHREAVMARGVRLDESVPGTGLGLAIAQDLAALYGGELLLQEAPGRGLCAVLRLPASTA